MLGSCVIFERFGRTQRDRLGVANAQDRPSRPRCHGAQTGRARAAEQCQQYGLRLVVGGVAGKRTGPEHPLPGDAGSCFEVGPVEQLDGFAPQVEAESLRGPGSTGGVVVGRGPEPMVHVNGGDITTGRNGKPDEGGGIGATRQSALHRRAGGREGASPQEFGDHGLISYGKSVAVIRDRTTVGGVSTHPARTSEP